MDHSKPTNSYNLEATTPSPPSSNADGVSRTHPLGEDRQEPYYFLSEPSISEDGSSTQYTGTPLSPMNGADITMIHSPSNTSLSSLGSPGTGGTATGGRNGGTSGNTQQMSFKARQKTYITANPIGQFESLLGPMDKGLSSSLDDHDFHLQSTITTTLTEIEEEEGKEHDATEPIAKVPVISGQSSLTPIHFQDEENILNVSYHSYSSTTAASDVEKSTFINVLDTNYDDTKNKNSREEDQKNNSSNYSMHTNTVNETPESSRYHSAFESPGGEMLEEDTQSGDLSYDGSSSSSEEDEKEQDRSTFSSKHVGAMNEPHITMQPTINNDDDEQLLLPYKSAESQDTHRSMDMSSIIPEAKVTPPLESTVLETPPYSATLMNVSILQEDNVTPKRKTLSKHSSLDKLDIVDLTSHLDSLEDTGESDVMDTKITPHKGNSASSDKRKQHIRKRSGDEAAASIYTGGSDWIGMEQDKIPLPNERGLDDDIDYDDGSFKLDSRRRMKNTTQNNKITTPLDAVDEISTKFSPQLTRGTYNANKVDGQRFDDFPAMTRKNSFGDRSTSTYDSESNFSWISQRTFQTKDTSSIKELKNEGTDTSSNGLGSKRWMNQSASFQAQSNEGLSQMQPISTNTSANFSKTPEPTIQRLESQGFIENEMKTFQSQLHARSKSDESILQSVTSTPYHALVTLEEGTFPTYTCPRCKTIQREFFTVSSVNKESNKGSGGWLVATFIIYMIGSLFLFGWEEGWPKLDCFYFSVMTLTTTGPGDYVPVDNAAKIICSIFIYFGTCCIGLSLGYLQANSLDDSARKTADENKVLNCPNCNSIADLASPPRKRRHRRTNDQSLHLQPINEKTNSMVWDNQSVDDSLLSDENDSLGPIDVNQVMERQTRTRHQSLVNTDAMKNIFDPGYSPYQNRYRIYTDTTNKMGLRADHEKTQLDSDHDDASSADSDHDDASSASSLSIKVAETDDDIFHPVSSMRAAKYIFLTMKQAFANSLFIIAVGSATFYFIEGWSVVDSFYYTTVLFTTVGYGDIVPVTSAGKIFASVYGLVAIAVLLQIISMISMIPLELRKRRIENAVLLQFGDELDDAALRELAFGPMMRRLQISESSPEGLGHCTREMFSLAMLVRLGRISEQDVRSTFAAFRRLDRDNDGLLTSREIIMSTVERRKRSVMKEDAKDSVKNLLPRKMTGLASPIEPDIVSEMTTLLLHPPSSYTGQNQYGVEVVNGDGSLRRNFRGQVRDEVV